MIKILFVYTNPLGIPYPDLGIASLSSFIKSKNKDIEVKLLDFTFGLSIKKALRIVKEFQPNLLCFTSRSNEFSEVVKIANSIRKNYSKSIFICGGVHPTIDPSDAFRSCFDGVCIGEGEIALNDLISKIKNNKDLTRTNNFWFRKKDGQVIKNPSNKLISNLDELPIIDYDLFEIDKYLSVRCGQLDYISERGCPFQCTYCINHTLIRKYKGLGTYARFKNAKTIIKELTYLKTKFKKKLKSIQFQDELFILNKERLNEFSLEYKKKIGLPFECDVRADFCNEKSLTDLKNMGCEKVNIAIETGDEELRFNLLNKRVTDEQIVNAFHLCKKYGFKTMSFNMVGLPNETPEQINKTISLNQIVRPDAMQVSIFTPYKGTKLFEYCKENGLLTNEQLTDSYYLEGGYLKNPNMTNKQIERARIFFGYNYYKKFSSIKAVLMLCRDFFIPYYLRINPYLPSFIKKSIYYLFWNFKPLKFLSK